jgi:hypothetical protein
MAINFPSSPTNGQTATIDGVTYSWNPSGSVWDLVTSVTTGPTGPTGPSGTITVTAPVTNTGTSTAAVLGIQSNPTFGNQVNITNSTALGSSAGNQVNLLKLTANSGNGDQLEITNTRTVNGSFWPSGGYRIQQKIDATWMGYIQFNGNNDGGIAIGTGASSTSPLSPTDKLKINQSGHVTLPAQPRFFCWRSAGDVAVGNVVLYDQVGVNVGSVYNASNGRFTAPVAGTYDFTTEAIFGTTLGTYRLYYRVNGAVYQGDYHLRVHNYTGGEYTKGARSLTINLAAGDYVEMYFGAGPAALYGLSQYATFSGYLLG